MQVQQRELVRIVEGIKQERERLSFIEEKYQKVIGEQKALL